MYKSMLERMKKEESGFTLVELLMVIVILGILSAVVVFSLAGLGDKGQKSACKADYNTLITAEEAHYADVIKGGTWVSEAQLVTDKFLAQTSPNYDITLPVGGTYTIIPQPGASSACLSPPA